MNFQQTNSRLLHIPSPIELGDTIRRCVLIHLPDIAPARRWYEECRVAAQMYREDVHPINLPKSAVVEPIITYPDLIHLEPPLDYVYVAHLGIQAWRHRVAYVRQYTLDQVQHTDPLFRSRFYLQSPYMYVYQDAEEVEHIPVPTPSSKEGRISGLVIGDEPHLKPIWDNRVIRFTRQKTND